MDEARWVDDDEGLAAVVDRLRTEPCYAVDTEFHRERTYWPHLALVQVAWPGGAALVDPQAVDVRPLAEVLRGEGTAVVHAASQDLEVLDRACGAVPARLFDTQVAAGFLGFSWPSLTILLDRVLGVHLPKGDRLTDWTRRPLLPAQREYAAADVRHLLDLRAELAKRLADCGRLGWAEEECQVLLDRSRLPQDPDTAWWKIKESRSLRGRARGVAQAVAAWRERKAASTDRPTRMVLPDLAILGLAHRVPDDEAGLRDVRGLEGRYVRGGTAAELLAVVRDGAALPASAIRLPPVDEVERRLRPAATLVSAWISQLARDLRIDAALLATRADLHDLLQQRPEARLARGWRAGLVGEPVRRLVDGEVALAFRRGKGDLVLEERSNRPVPVEAAVPDDVSEPREPAEPPEPAGPAEPPEPPEPAGG